MLDALPRPGSSLRPSGHPHLGDVPWGTHVCQFYRTQGDLLDALVPFFQAGLEGNERCLWVASGTVPAAAAREALALAVPDLSDRIASGQIEILDAAEADLRDGAFDANRVLDGWRAHEEHALAAGYEGLRVCGDMSWLPAPDGKVLAAYESAAHERIQGRRVLAVCCYALDRCQPEHVLDVLRAHRCALVPKGGEWEVVGSVTELLAELGDDAVPAADEAAVADGRPAPTASHAHSVRFFDEHQYPDDRIADYLIAALHENGAAMVFATQESNPFPWKPPGPAAGVRAGAISRRVLVVDDNKDAAQILADALSLMGHMVRVAHDGPSAIAVAGPFQPEVALLDLGLPVMDGYELAQRLSREGRPRLVAVTGYGQEADFERSRAAGFDGHLVKPVDLDRLQNTIERLFAEA